MLVTTHEGSQLYNIFDIMVVKSRTSEWAGMITTKFEDRVSKVKLKSFQLCL